MSTGFPGATPRVYGRSMRRGPTVEVYEGGFVLERCPTCGRHLKEMTDWPKVRVTGIEDAVDDVRRESLSRLVRRGPFLLQWGTVPGCASGAMQRCLVDELGLNWAAGAEVHPVGDRSVLVIKGRRWCMVTLDQDELVAHLEVDDGRRLELGVARLGNRVDLHIPLDDDDVDDRTAPYLWARDPAAVHSARAAVAHLKGFVGTDADPVRMAELWRAEGFSGPWARYHEFRGVRIVQVGGYALYLDDNVLTLVDADRIGGGTDGPPPVTFRLARVLYEGKLLEESGDNGQG